MKRFLLLAAVVFAACSQTGVTNLGSLAAPLDLVMVDRLPDKVGAEQPLATGALTSGLVFVTSTDSNELKLFEPYRGGAVVTTDWARGPDPLETLSIPVTDWADTVVADEGRAIGSSRRTGPYVYAARRGGRELSVVNVRDRNTLARRVLLPAPMSAMAAWMEIVDDNIPGTTTLYVATWDGQTGRLTHASLETDPALLTPKLRNDGLKLMEDASFPGETIRAIQVIPHRADRTLDGTAFCAANTCLAVATSSATGGRTVLFDPVSKVTAPLDFGGPVRKLAISMRYDGDIRLYGVLDEERCGGPTVCGGVVSVNIATGTGGGFVRSTDLSNLPMQPLRVGTGLITGLTIGSEAQLLRGVEYADDSGVSSSPKLSAAEDLAGTELGAFSSTNGYVTYFDPVSGLIIDNDARRADLDSALWRLPGALDDGGFALIDVDGGALGTQEVATLSWAPFIVDTHTVPWRDITVSAGGFDWRVELFDGYLPSQFVYVVAHGALPALSALTTSPADGTHLTVPVGYESRVRVGDYVDFFTGDSTNGYAACGRASVIAIGVGAVDVDMVPVECAGRSIFSVSAGPTMPLVASADLDGYLTRGEPGTTLVYERRLALTTRFVQRYDVYTDAGTQIAFAPREALKITAPAAMPMEEGTALTFFINGYQSPYRVSVDVTSAGPCYLSSTTPSQVEIGTIAMGLAPWAQTSSTNAVQQWGLIGTVPSGNAIITMRQEYLVSGALGIQNLVQCWQ